MAVFGKILSVVEICILLVAVGCGITGAIMIGLTSNQFGSHCILKAGVEDLSGFISLQYSGMSRCNYCMLIQIVALLLAFVFGAYRLLVLCSGKYDIKTFGRLIVSIVFGALTFLMLIEACLVNVGLNKFCGNLSAVYTTVTGCRTFQTSIIWFTGENGAHFYDNMKVAESVSWIGVLLWLSMTLLSIVSHCTYKRQRPHAHRQDPKAVKTVPALGPV
ncbi:transmembrane protein 179B-like [Asterias rubens]|uniref:transmembrane protein 179B-like n=1 Tax=Asterias rubens TaxID=7604 RepID=UPI00145504CB|nr:transmembrane protein 179B-like [Asterias rubens]